MRKALPLLAAILLLVVLPARADVPWINNDIDEAKRLSTVKKRPLLIYFYTTWCSWCAELEDKVFSNEEVIEAVEGFIPLRVNSSVRLSSSATSRYKVSSFPTIVVVSSDGEVLGRLGMYRSAPEFLRFLKDCLTPGDTLAAIDDRIAKGDKATELILRSAQKHFEAGELDTAKRRYEEALSLIVEAKDPEAASDAHIGLAAVKSSMGDEAGALEQYQTILTSQQGSRRLAEAFVASLAILREQGREAKIDALLMEFADRFPDDPAVLNDYARRLLETKGDGALALRKASRAAELSPNSGNYQATLARALLQAGRPDAALEAVNRAINLRPTDTEIRVLRLEVWEAQRAAAETPSAPHIDPPSPPSKP